ncbi:MAG: beta-methylgalactoside transporter [Lachnospiraceae bacterium]|jgi:methyl-galactoside transport system permease protein|nr:beta-methylgalactoside transporter [Lachnospiraceae bacterium]
MEKSKQNLKDRLLGYSLYFILLAILIITVILEPKFVSFRNLTNILQMASTRSIIAMGIAGLIIINGTDLSAGRVVGCCCAVSAALLQNPEYPAKMFSGLGHVPLVVGWLASVAVAVIFATLIGFCVAYLHMHAFIASLGMQLAAYGFLCLFMDSNGNNGQPLSNLAPHYDTFVKGAINLGGVRIPYLIFYMIIVAVIMWIIWNKTILGKNMYAIGGNIEAARVSGINVERWTVLIFVLSGICVGTGSFLECSRIGSVTANTGLQYEFDAISGAVIGGVSFAGGVGTIPGVIMGVIILQTINYCLYFLGVSSYYQYIARGLIIIIAVAIDVRKYIKKK